MDKFYLTTAIPYANASPHIGTAIDYLLGDVILRYQKQRGYKVLLSIGTDEHGSKVEKKAESLGLSPQAFVDKLQPEFQKMRQALNLNFCAPIDQVHQPLKFQSLDQQSIVNVRTSDPGHVSRVQAIWQKLDQAGVIYKDSYEGWYCSGCEAFITETEAHDMDYICADHKKPLERLKEENYYLKVSKFTSQIKEFIKSSVIPEFRGRELLGLIEDEAKDVSISRPKSKLTWGVPVPGDDSQVMYVWVDALSNYLTALNYPDDDWHKDYWPAQIEIVGKDILRFHAIIWPAMLLALGLELPKKLLVHGFINVNGAKMSKSLGNVVSPIDIIDRYGADAFRYYFTSHVPTFDDGDFTFAKFNEAYNNELANDYGNLISRVSAMIRKYLAGDLSGLNEINEMSDATETLDSMYKVSMNGLDLNTAITACFKYIRSLNQYIERMAPWQVNKLDDAKEKADRLQAIFSTLVNDIKHVNQYLSPFLPDTASKVEDIFEGSQVAKNTPILFPKIELED